MAKLILISILLSTFLVPALLARDPSPVRGFRRLVVALVACNLVYLFAVLVIYPRLG